MPRKTGSTAGSTLEQTGPDSGRAPASGRSHGPLERVTVNLTPRSVKALEEVVGITQDTKTDVINRSLQVYAYLEKIIQDGGSVYVRAAESTDLERLKFF
jgi:hypothetical protein